jgi:hypothetical protein
VSYGHTIPIFAQDILAELIDEELKWSWPNTHCSEIELHGAVWTGKSLRFANQLICSVKSFSGSIH